MINASGTFDRSPRAAAFGEAALREDFPFAAFVSKTITLEPRAGNPPPRLWEAPAGLINSIGLPNKGLEGYLAQELPVLARLLPTPRLGASVPLITNVMGSTAAGARELRRALRRAPGDRGDRAERVLPERQDGPRHRRRPAGAGARSCGRCARATAKPLIVKLTPNTADVAACAAAAEAGGADAVSLINTLRAMALAPAAMRGRRSARAAPRGWAAAPAACRVRRSGRSRSPRSRRWPARVAIPVVGMGGVQNAAHARDLLDAGATLVAVGTESFRDPAAGGADRPRAGGTAHARLRLPVKLAGRPASGGIENPCKRRPDRPPASTYLDLKLR